MVSSKAYPHLPHGDPEPAASTGFKDAKAVPLLFGWCETDFL
jgi:hypothetical protein